MDAIRVKVDHDNLRNGWFLGLLLDERGDTVAVVRLDGMGMMLSAFHPSKITPIEEER